MYKSDIRVVVNCLTVLQHHNLYFFLWFGLVTFTAESKIKEIGVASVWEQVLEVLLDYYRKIF